MALVQVEVVGPEPTKGRLDTFDEVLARQSAVVWMFGHGEEGFGCQHDVMSRKFLKALAERSLGFAFCVDVRGVEKIDAEIERAVDEAGGLREIDAGAQGEPRPEGDFADLKAATAQRSCSHGRQSSPRADRQHLFRFAVDSAAVLHLAKETSTDWLPRAIAHLDEILVDHAHCEKKAAGAAVKLLFSYPHHRFLQEPLAELAREELDHFQQVSGASRCAPDSLRVDSPKPLRHRVACAGSPR